MGLLLHSASLYITTDENWEMIIQCQSFVLLYKVQRWCLQHRLQYLQQDRTLINPLSRYSVVFN